MMKNRFPIRRAATVFLMAAVQALVWSSPSASADETVSLQQTADDGLRVINYNTMLLSKWMTLDNTSFNNEARVRAMLDSGALDGQDVVVLQELFNVKTAKQLLNGLYDKGYRYQTRVVGASSWDGIHARNWDAEHLNGGGLENGGVAVVSRHPIESAEQQVFAQGCAADKHAQKGFAYTRINKHGRVFHVVGTHPQATDSGCGSRDQAAETRASQFKEIDGFLTAKEQRDEISSSQPVLLIGDMNVDRFTPEYPEMLALLHATDGSRTGERYSFNPKDNELAGIRYPDDAPEDLDFALQREGHTPMRDWAGTTLRPRAEPPIDVQGRTGLGGIILNDRVRDLSDHYALAASGRLPDRSEASWKLRVDRVRMVKGDEQGASGDDLYGTLAVNGQALWSVAKADSLDDKHFPYDLPGISQEEVSGSDGRFTIRIQILDNDDVGDDEIVNQSLTWRAADDRLGTHTVTVTGAYGAAELTYTVSTG
ncbi:sphingomyelin phosphodiesterase [Streptomyces lavendulae]|uniref:sphingomyelin phosphodiesterase n=1 Tax=Streptomyces lavendulae TaxID=1914 RepID=UPI003719BA75